MKETKGPPNVIKQLGLSIPEEGLRGFSKGSPNPMDNKSGELITSTEIRNQTEAGLDSGGIN
jgi:hypothetical protein